MGAVLTDDAGMSELGDGPARRLGCRPDDGGDVLAPGKLGGDGLGVA
jgi:hypothetical protein